MAASPRLFPITLEMPARAFLQRFGSVLIIPGIFSHGPWVFTARRSRQRIAFFPGDSSPEAVCSSLRAGPLGTLTWGCVPDLTPALRPWHFTALELRELTTHTFYSHLLLLSEFLG